QILLLTSTVLIHIRYSFENDSEVVYDEIAKFDIQSLLPPSLANKYVIAVSLDPSSEYSFFLSVDSSIVLLKRAADKWMCRVMQEYEEKAHVMFIPPLEMAVVAGKHETKFISTSFRQPGVSKDQLRVL
ncbi:hypothetical protein PMAYCL1PPCAC_24148, partial [Pristionchus mayeri]